MFSVANLLDRAKAQAGIDSDYRLSKILQINQTRLSNYRSGRSLPNVELIEALCALSGDDAGLIVAQVEAARAADGPVRNMWLSVAARLRGAAQTAILSVCFAIALIAFPASDARAVTVDAYKTGSVNLLYIVSTTILSVQHFLLVRLRRWRAVFRIGFVLALL
jgi:hypothetical protein